MVFHGFVIFITQGQRRAEHSLVTGQGFRIDDLGAGQLVLEIANRRFDLALAFLGRVIFGIFRQIAVGTRGFDRVDDDGTLQFQRLEFGLHFNMAFGEHWYFFNSH